MRHVIPKNVSSDGGIAGGAIKKKNAIEAGIYIVICFFLFKNISFFLPILPRIIAFSIVGILPALVMLVGLNDQSAVEFLTTKIRYMRREDIIPYVIQTENYEEAPKTLIEKYDRKFKNKARIKEEKQQQYERELQFIMNDPSSTPRQKKKASKKLAKEEKAKLSQKRKEEKDQIKKEAKENKKKKKGKKK